MNVLKREVKRRIKEENRLAAVISSVTPDKIVKSNKFLS